MAKFIMILKQISKFVLYLSKFSIMNKKTKKQIFIFFILLISSLNLAQAQCAWLYEDRAPGSYIIEENNIVLFYCQNIMDTIYAPNQYTDVLWEYTTKSGIECQDWDWLGNNFFFSINYNDPCLETIKNNTITVTFSGTIDEKSPPETCTFDILFNDPGTPVIEIENYDTNNQISICENDNITLVASALGSNPNYSSFTWYLNGEIIEGENSIELSVSSTNYDINTANTFYFSATNYCSELNDSNLESEWLTISIYEGYEGCEPCEWDLADYDNSEFYGFCGDCEGEGYFPEPPNNEENRSFENPRLPTCEATKYKIRIYNRLGRQLFESDYDNHPWNGKLENGKRCKEGTYYYTMEYILNPFLTENNQNNTKTSTGTVYLDWEN